MFSCFDPRRSHPLTSRLRFKNLNAILPPHIHSTMKQNFLLVAVTILGILFSSCQKEDSDDQNSGSGNNNGDLVKTYTEAISSPSIKSSITYNLSYDNNGRIISMISASSPGNKFVFSYPSNTTHSMDIYANGAITIHEDFFLNANFFVDSTFQYNDTQDTTTEKYTYNINKQVTQIKEYEYSKRTGSILSNTTKYSYDADGNITRQEDTDKNVHTFEYYSNLSYVQPLIMGTPTLVSNKKANLVKKHTFTSNGFTVASAQLTYTFDNKDRISTEKATLADGSTVTKTYTYF
jgi:hypothetical protein